MENKFSKSLMKKIFSVYFVLMSVWCVCVRDFVCRVVWTLVRYDESFIMCLMERKVFCTNKIKKRTQGEDAKHIVCTKKVGNILVY